MVRILIYVQHLLGIGHLQRCVHIASALTQRGVNVDIASGGMPVHEIVPDKITVHQLPALKAGPAGFRDLRDSKDTPVSPMHWAGRARQLRDIVQHVRPDVLIVEAFPFGRWQMRDEVSALLDTARDADPRPAIVSSIRDILQISHKPGRAERTIDAVRNQFDAVLVHGDPDMIRLEESFPQAIKITDWLYYTGIVAGPLTATQPYKQEGEVIVSAGGGAVGRDLLHAALAARDQCALAMNPWRLITGPNLPDPEFDALAAAAPDGVIVERFRKDFRQRLGAAALSISQAGYNTTADVLQARVPAVLVPFTGEGRESEQRMRADRLQNLGLAISLDDQTLTAPKLAAAINQASHLRQDAKSPDLDLNGAENSAGLIAEWAKRARSRLPISDRPA